MAHTQNDVLARYPSRRKNRSCSNQQVRSRRFRNFLKTEDQITIEIKIPSPLGEEGETHRHDWVMPVGTAKVEDIVKVEIIEP